MKLIITLLLFIASSASASVFVDWRRIPDIQVLCAHSAQEIEAGLGTPSDSEVCAIADESSVLFGIEWVLFKHNHAFAIVHIQNYHGPCWDAYPNGTKFNNICMR